MKAVTKTLSSASLIERASLLIRVTYDLKLSSFHCLIFSRITEDLLYLCPPMKYVTKCPLNSLKVEIVLGAAPLSVVGNALHMISSRTPCRCIKVLNDSRQLSGSLDLS